MTTVKDRYRAAIEEAIAFARFSHSRATVKADDGSEAYAYPHRDGVAWGVNGPQGVNILRGIRRPDGSDMAVG